MGEPTLAQRMAQVLAHEELLVSALVGTPIDGHEIDRVIQEAGRVLERMLAEVPEQVAMAHYGRLQSDPSGHETQEQTDIGTDAMTLAENCRQVLGLEEPK